MNNSKLAIDSQPILPESPIDNTIVLRESEARLIKIIKAIKGINSTDDWSSLKNEVFDSLVVTLEKDLRDEAKKNEPDPLKLSRLAGQLKWAEKYADLDKLAEVFRVELTRIRTLLYGQKES